MRARYIWITIAVVVVALIVGGIIAKHKKAAKPAVAYTVAAQDIKQTVVATGTVTSQADLDLGFKDSGTIAAVNVSVGQAVHQGQVLMSLDQSAASAAVNQAKANLLSAQASYDKTVNGDSSQEIAVQQAAVNSSQVAVQNAQTAYQNTLTQQQTAVQNAQNAEINAGLAATPSPGNLSSATIAVSGTYTGAAQGSYTITMYASGTGLTYQYSGLESGTGNVSTAIPLPLGKNGLYLTFSSTGSFHSGDTWTVSIPNTQSSQYLAAENAYQAALQTQQQQDAAAKGAVDSAQAALQQAQAQLALDQAPARSEDVESAQGSLAAAQAALQSAETQYAGGEIIAPIDGTISVVDGKVGQQATPDQEQVALIDASSLHVESDISESSIALVQPGQSIDMTFDAFGQDQHFTGAVLSIDPASTVISGVTDFRVVSSLPSDPAILTGMSVNLTILTNEKQNTLAVPNRLIQTGSDGKQFVTVIGKDGKTGSVDITTGLFGDTYTEITSGLSGGEQIAAPANS